MSKKIATPTDFDPEKITQENYLDDLNLERIIQEGDREIERLIQETEAWYKRFWKDEEAGIAGWEKK